MNVYSLNLENMLQVKNPPPKYKFNKILSLEKLIEVLGKHNTPASECFQSWNRSLS